MNSDDFRRETDRNIDTINKRLDSIEKQLDDKFDRIIDKIDSLPKNFITRLEAWAVGGVSGLVISVLGLVFLVKDHVSK